MQNSGIAISLGKTARRAGYRMQTQAEVSSTSDIALGRAREGERSRLWIVARSQTKGRGRHGRVFLSPPGNLYASLFLNEGCRASHAPELGFVAGLALFDAAAALTGLAHPRLSLKWPNDLLVDGKKCAGVLLEGHALHDGVFALIIGIGVNVAVLPPGLPNTAMLKDVAPDVTVEALFLHLSDSFARRFSDWTQAPRWSQAHFAAWAERAHGIGSQVRVKMPTAEVEGRFRGLDRGRLLLDTSEGLVKLDAGDLYVLDQSPASQGQVA
ncbi:MAG: biotin--[acetyl-CoA-carboxylase] ligase [Hyphomicrobiales bacterium]|nr:biotin--[acetyl-CoA-carboxylase] ligase [Hyphomicrobiales bacterium]